MIDCFLSKKCFACQSCKLDVQYSTGDVVCIDCGEVISHVISEGNEVVDYSGNDDSAHHTSRVSGLSSSFISSQTEFVDGPEHIRAALKRAQVFSQDKQESMVTKNICVVNDYCDRLSLGRPIQECAIDLFSRTLRQRLVASKAKEPVIAACVYLASRLKHCPRTLQEASQALFVDHSQLSHYQSLIARGLELPLGQVAVGPEHLVNRYCSQLQLPPPCVSFAYDMARSVSTLGFYSDTPPQKVAGAIILWVAVLGRHELDLVDLSVVCQVALTQLKVMFVKLFDSLVLTVPSALCEVFCGRPGVGGGSLGAYLPARENILTLLSRSKTVVLPVVKHYAVSSSSLTSSNTFTTSSSSSGSTSGESNWGLPTSPSEAEEELFYNYNYYAKKRRQHAAMEEDHCSFTVDGKGWIASYLPYSRPKYGCVKSTHCSQKRRFVCTTQRKQDRLTAMGVQIQDKVVDVTSLIKGFGLETVLKPFKKRKSEEELSEL